MFFDILDSDVVIAVRNTILSCFEYNAGIVTSCYLCCLRGCLYIFLNDK